MSLRKLTIILVLFPLGLWAQDGGYSPIRSNQVWLSASVNLRPFKELDTRSDFLKKIKSSVELGYRSEDFFGQTNSLYTDISFRRKINDWLRGGIEYRFALKDSDSRNSSRLQFFVTSSKEIGQFDLDYKGRYQRKFVSVTKERHVLRNRISLTYRTPNFRINPKLSAEAFTWFRYTGTQFAGMRYSLSGNVNLPNGQELDIGIKHDREIGVYEPTYRLIFSVAYSYDL